MEVIDPLRCYPHDYMFNGDPIGNLFYRWQGEIAGRLGTLEKQNPYLPNQHQMLSQATYWWLRGWDIGRRMRNRVERQLDEEMELGKRMTKLFG